MSPASSKAAFLLMFGLFMASHDAAGQQAGALAAAAQHGFHISGTVINAISGEPLAGTKVMITATLGGDLQRTMITGENGRFLFGEIPAGVYSLAAEHRTFRRQALDQHESYSTAVIVGEQKEADNLLFRLQPDASITGRITDEHGDGVANADAVLFEKKIKNGEQGIFQHTEVMADSKGRYHFGHLSPGTYYVVVSAQPWYAESISREALANQDATWRRDDEAELDVAYPVTYYPGLTYADGSTAIALRAGDRFSADMTLKAVRAAHLFVNRLNSVDPAGKVSTKITQPVFDTPGAFIEIRVTSAVSDNSLELMGLPPGSFDVRLNPLSEKSKEPLRSRRQAVKVPGEYGFDAGKSPLAALVKGSVRFEGETVTPSHASLQLRGLEAAGNTENALDADGHFDPLQVDPGRYFIHLSGAENFVVKSVSATGARMVGPVIEIDGTGPVELSVLATRGYGRVEGAVRRNGRPVAGAMVLLVPQETTEDTRLFRREQSATDGTFSLQQVPSGKYIILALENGWDIEWTNPKILEAYLGKGQRLAIQANGYLSLTVNSQ